MDKEIDQNSTAERESINSSIIEHTTNSNPTSPFDDNSPDAVEMRIYQQRINNTSENKQLSRYQKDIASHSQKQKGSVIPKDNGRGLPTALKLKAEELSGYAFDTVRVYYNSEKPAQIGAFAYTEGTNIYIGPGKEEYLYHEVWHIIQRLRGSIPITLETEEGTSINDDIRLEDEADTMGDKLARLTQKASPISDKDTPEQTKQLKNMPANISQVVQRKVGFEIETNIPVHRKIHAEDQLLLQKIASTEGSLTGVNLGISFALLNLSNSEKNFVQHFLPNVFHLLPTDSDKLSDMYSRAKGEDVINNPDYAIEDLEDKIKNKFTGKIFKNEYLKYSFAHSQGAASKEKFNKDDIIKGLAIVGVKKLQMLAKYGLGYTKEIGMSEKEYINGDHLAFHVDSSIDSETNAKENAPVIGSAILEIVSDPLVNIEEGEEFIEEIEALIEHIDFETDHWREQGKINKKIWTGPLYRSEDKGFDVKTETVGTFQVNFGSTLRDYIAKTHGLLDNTSTENEEREYPTADLQGQHMGYLMPNDISNLTMATSLENQLVSLKEFDSLSNPAKEFFRVLILDLSSRFAGSKAKGWNKNAGPFLIKSNFKDLYKLIPVRSRPSKRKAYRVLNEIENLVNGTAGTNERNQEHVTHLINHVKTSLNWFKKVRPYAEDTTTTGRVMPVEDKLFVVETRFHQRTKEPLSKWPDLIRAAMGAYLPPE